MPNKSAFKPQAVFTLGLLLCGIAVSGCNRGLAIKESSAFNSAPAELKTQWDSAFAASKTNGYAYASLTLQSLRAQTNLNAEQISAVDELMGVVGARMVKAANDGDPQAVKALKEVRDATSRRR